MRASKMLLLLSVFLLPSSLAADVLIGDTTWNFNSSPGIDLEMSIDTDSNLVDIIISGRDDGWFSVGFGSTTMADTYGIVVFQDGSYDERDLNYSGGTVLDSSLTLISSDVTGSTRTMHFRRGRVGIASEHYTFQTTPGILNLIGASDGGGYGYHGGTNRSSNTIDLQPVPEPASGVLMGLAGISLVFRRRRSSLA